MKVSSLILIFGMLFGSIFLILNLPGYIPDEYRLFIFIFPLVLSIRLATSG